MMLSKELTEYLRFLSKRDTKNLTQKTLKTTEELGELARKVLPYENAFATNHRIVTKANILEEVADTMLCILSIAHDIEASDEDIESMVSRKAAVWAEKQEAEIGLSFPIPFEIHITVSASAPGFDLENFKLACKDVGVKPIVIDLQNNSGAAVMQDVMTSSKHFGDNNTVMKEVERISNGLRHQCFSVVREKVESVPWHPAAPRRNNSTSEMPKDCYFESHFAVILENNGTDETSDLDAIAAEHNLHKSRNIFKTYENGTQIIMLTSRSYDGTYEDFLEKAEAVKAAFAAKSYEIEKVIIEFSVFDTRVSHDSVWLSRSVPAQASDGGHYKELVKTLTGVQRPVTVREDG
jgi:NTP pyrophosphatase (non-canonical NTP hydrolase)